MGLPHATNKEKLKGALTKVYLDALKKSKKESPPETQAKELAEGIASAIADFVENIMVKVDVTIPPALIAPPSSISTAGSPAAQVNVTPVPINPVSLPPTFGKVT
ncbi:hypothetical protein EBS02_02900 [bacterium]|nr:hypothetical protein [bacterium]